MHKLQTAAFEKVIADLVLTSDAREDRIPAAADGLHVCDGCGSKLVYPTEWEEDGDDAWHVARRCPDCESVGGGRFESKLVDELERELDRADAELAADLALLTHANMVDEIERFSRALDADAIQPFDF